MTNQRSVVVRMMFVSIFEFLCLHVWAAMPRANSNHSILLGSALGKDYQEAAWQDLIAHVSIHKMNYRKVGEAMENPNSYCNHIMNEGY